MQWSGDNIAERFEQRPRAVRGVFDAPSFNPRSRLAASLEEKAEYIATAALGLGGAVAVGFGHLEGSYVMTLALAPLMRAIYLNGRRTTLPPH